MGERREDWDAVDDYFVDRLVNEDDALTGARAHAAQAGIPDIAVAANQGALLAIIAQIAGARRVLEFGTLAGYSTICLARAVGADGSVITFEIDETHAAVARENLTRAGVADRVEVVVGPAVESVQRLIDDAVQPFDFVFIDADKTNNARYVEAALRLSHPGTVIVVDNVVRGGAVADATSTDPNVIGTRAVIDLLAQDERLVATAVQTVGHKGWDGFAIALVR